MNLLTNAKAFLKMLTPLSILMFWACSIFASPIDTAILSSSFKNSETSVVIDDVCANPNANVKGGTNSIKIKGITTKSAAIQIFNSAWATVYNQQVSSDSVTVSNLAAGTYNVKVTVLQAGGRWPAICSVLVNNVNVVTGANPCNTDKQAPVFANCPQNINLSTSTTTAVAKWTPPTATDNCTATPSVSSNYNSGFAFPIGSKTVTYTAADAKGNKATCSFIVNVVQNNNCRYSDSLALVDVYNNMGGANWTSTKWDLTKSIENWIGVQLDSNGCVRLLVASEAMGAISPSIGKLSQLEILYLNTGKITDTLPSSLGNLTKLKQFYSYGGKITGKIPSSFGNMASMEELILESNQLSGNIPSSLGNLKKLRLLVLRRNKLTGNIPNSFVNLPNLEYLELSDNLLSGSLQSIFGNIKTLRTLNLSTNSFTDTLPKNLSDLPNLSTLKLSNNLLNGCIPGGYKNLCGKDVDISNNPNLTNGGDWAAFCSTRAGSCDTSTSSCRYLDSLGLVALYNNTNGANWTNKWDLTKSIDTWYGIGLTVSGCVLSINLNENNLVGTIPNFSFNELDGLNLCYNKLNGSIPNFNLPKLKYLRLFVNGLSGNIPNFNLPNLEELLLNSNQLVGNIPNFDLPKLKRIWLSYNSLTGNISNYKLPNLEELDFSFNKLVGSIPNLNFNKLKKLWLFNNQLSGNLPDFSLLTSLEDLNISDNKLVGNIPNFNQTSLKYILIFNNQLQGEISNFVLPNLVSLLLGNNNLTGIIPDFNFPNLEFLSLDRNQISGTIPPFNFSKLKGLLLYNNRLVGNIPLFNFPNIDAISLSNNQLTGSIPNIEMPNLNIFYVANNQLSGCIPSSLKKLCGKSVDISNNPNLPNGGDWFAFCNTGAGGCTVSSDLALSISTINANYSPYTTVNFKIKVENKSSNAMTAIKIRFAYPPQTVNGGGATPSVGTWTEYCSGGILCYEWTIPTLDANAVATLDVPLFILATSTPIVANVNLLNSTPVDTEVSNNTATVSIAPPALPAQFLATPKRPKPSQYIPIVIQTVAPNPTEGDILIEIESIIEKEVRFDFYNTLGKIVKSETKAVKKGENYLQFDFWNETNGVYFIQTNVGQGRGVPLKFVKL